MIIIYTKPTQQSLPKRLKLQRKGGITFEYNILIIKELIMSLSVLFAILIPIGLFIYRSMKSTSSLRFQCTHALYRELDIKSDQHKFFKENYTEFKTHIQSNREIIQATLSGAINAYSANSSINNSKEQFVDLWMSMMWPALYSSFTSGESLRDSISKSTEALDLAQQNHIQNVFSKNNLNNI
jgi:hypothetical protein